MGKKYKLLEDDCIEHEGKILYRIKALKEFGDIKKGDIGGYIQSEDNLSHKGNCWVYNDSKVYCNAEILDNGKIYGDAKIYNDACVYGSAEVFENANIFDNAQIYDNGKVYGNAQIYGDAEVFGSARIYGNAKVYDEAEVFGNTTINNGDIIGKVSIPYKKIFQHQCCKRVLTAILTEDNKILYSIGCQENLTKEEFIDRIHNEDGGLEKNPYREEYLRLIPAIEAYFKGE